MYMGLYRADGDVQRVADFLVILIREKNLQDVLFPGGQLIVIGKVEEGRVGIFLVRRNLDRRRRRFLENGSGIPYIRGSLSCLVRYLMAYMEYMILMISSDKLRLLILTMGLE